MEPNQESHNARVRLRTFLNEAWAEYQRHLERTPVSQIFIDHTKLMQATSRLAKAQANFNAVAEKVNTIMKPLHEELNAANEEFKKIVLQTAKDEAQHVTVDLNGLLAAATPAAPANDASAS
jgi:hypothetical protein